MTEATMTGAPPLTATRREWIGLAVIALPCLLYSMDLTVLNLAIPTLSRDLQPSSSQLLWIIDVYGFMVAGFLITMGTLGDRIGRRRLLLFGAAAFGVASVIAAFSRSAETLIASRALLGVAGATVAPSTLSLIRNMFHDERERTTAIGIWISSYSVGGAIGPLVGGVLLQHFWWGSVFLISVPVMVLILLLGPSLLPEYRDPGAGRIEATSVVLSLGAVLLSMYGVKRMAEHGVSWLPLASLGVGLLAGVLFVRRQRHSADPFIDLKLFSVPAFRGALLVYGLGCLTMFGIYIFIAQYLQLVLGLSPLEAGLWTVPWALSFVAGSLYTPRLVARIPTARLMTLGLLLAGASFMVFTQVRGPGGLAAIVIGSSGLALGLAPLFTLGNDLVVGTAPPERAGSASAISETSAELSGALGVGIFGSIGTLLYRRGMSAAELELTPVAERAATATLGGAVEVAQGAGAARDVIFSTARDAFLDGMQVTAVLSALIMVTCAVVVSRMLRSPNTG
jgi:DHA2 family multidrug resistance protein-like MFS transporter